MAGENEGGTDPLEENTGGEQVADPLEENAGGEQGEQGEEGQGTDPLLEQAGGKGKPAAAAPDSQADLASAIRDLRGTLSTPRQTPEQIEQAWQAAEQRSGKTRDQLIDEDRRMREVALMAVLEPNKEIGRGRVKEIVENDPEIAAAVEKAMAALPPAIQANPAAWADAAYIALGKAKKMGKTTTKQNEGGQGAGGTQRRVIGGTGTAGTKTGAAAGGKGNEKPKEYPAFEQHIINRQFGGKAEEYEKYKGKSSVESDVRITAGASANAADAELQRLTADNT